MQLPLLHRLQQTARRPRVQMVLTGALLGAAAFLLVYGFSPIAFTNDAWLRGGYIEADTVQHYAGWLLYRRSPWAFPLGMAQQINYPAGGYVGFSDSIPLLAVFFKLFAGVLPASFQYFGLWGFLCSALQGAVAAALVGLFTPSRLQNALCCLLFIFAPILSDRLLRHGALGAQWLVLLALYLYFKHRRSGRFFSPGFAVLAGLAMAIHPYFVPMVFAVLAALLLQNGLEQRALRAPLLALLACLAAALGTGLVLGAFSFGASAGSTPYGYFAMNLNALFNPSARSGHYSLVLPALAQTLGNFDAFNYLGLGLLLGLVALGVDGLRHFGRWRLGARLRRHAALAGVCLCLFAFAVSHQVMLQGRVLFTLPLPAALLRLSGIFRSSGRLFYPVWYLLALAVCVYLLRRPPLRWRTVAVAVLAAVQLLDLSPALALRVASFRPYVPVQASPFEQSAFWREAAGQFRHIASLDEEGVDGAMYLALYAADHGMTCDDAFTARFDPAVRAEQIATHLAHMHSSPPPADTLYVTSSETVFLDHAEALQGVMYCAQINARWYVFVPYSTGFAGFDGPGAVSIADYPFVISTYTDGLWDAGVLAGDRQVVCFEDTAFARRRLEGATALVAGGQAHTILDVNTHDVGWLLVTLDIPDAGVLRGVPLTPVRKDTP